MEDGIKAFSEKWCEIFEGAVTELKPVFGTEGDAAQALVAAMVFAIVPTVGHLSIKLERGLTGDAIEPALVKHLEQFTDATVDGIKSAAAEEQKNNPQDWLERFFDLAGVGRETRDEIRRKRAEMDGNHG